MKNKKSTDELLKILESENNINSYIQENKDDLTEPTTAGFLNEMLIKYNMDLTTAIKKSGLNQNYAYPIFSGKKTGASRNKLIQLIFGLGLNLDDAQRLLKIGNTGGLYPRVKRGSIIIFAINNKYDIITCDNLLYEKGEKTIINP